MTLTPEQWIVGAAAALLIGLSKTDVPGVGILVVPLMTLVFSGRASVGTTAPPLHVHLRLIVAIDTRPRRAQPSVEV